MIKYDMKKKESQFGPYAVYSADATEYDSDRPDDDQIFGEYFCYVVVDNRRWEIDTRKPQVLSCYTEIKQANKQAMRFEVDRLKAGGKPFRKLDRVFRERTIRNTPSGIGAFDRGFSTIHGISILEPLTQAMNDVIGESVFQSLADTDE